MHGDLTLNPDKSPFEPAVISESWVNVGGRCEGVYTIAAARLSNATVYDVGDRDQSKVAQIKKKTVEKPLNGSIAVLERGCEKEKRGARKSHTYRHATHQKGEMKLGTGSGSVQFTPHAYG